MKDSLSVFLDSSFLLNDRIQKIRSMDNSFNLCSNAYISFSGGKDSTILSTLIDEALPNNKIPRVYINTGIDYNAIVEFVRSLQEKDERFVIIKPSQNILKVLETYGYPFKSKEHSQKVAIYQHGGKTKTVRDYLGEGEKKAFTCPKCLRFNFTKDFKLKVSDKCCKFLKKLPAKEWSDLNKRPIVITGIRRGEGGLRQSMSGCAVFNDKDCKSLSHFHPLFPCSQEWLEWYIKERGIVLCKLYYPPYNFKRTGCKGCPFNIDLQAQLDIMGQFLPNERRQCEYIWHKVYDVYRAYEYRLHEPEFDL